MDQKTDIVFLKKKTYLNINIIDKHGLSYIKNENKHLTNIHTKSFLLSIDT